MVAFKFPMSAGQYIGEINREKLIELCKDYCCMFRVAITNLVPLKHIEHPLSSSKCRKKKEVVEDNGRVVTAAYLETTITEQDYFTYEEFYAWEDIKFFDCWIYYKQYLPTPFVKSILELYRDKTTLKGVEGEEVNYLLKKEMLNSCYGMTVTDIVRENLNFSELNPTGCESNYDILSTETQKEYEARMKKYLDDQIERYNNNPYRFLFYPWGVWVTAYSRANLFSGIIEADKDYIYSDTDSIKITNPEKHEEYIRKYNEDISERMRIACEFHGLDFSLTKPKNIQGVEKPLGVWEFEGIYDEFKTLGAKRYLCRAGNKWLFTVAGVNKFKAREYILKRTHEINRVRKHNGLKPQSPFHLFTMDLVVPKEFSGRMVVTYIDDVSKGTIVDYLGNKYDYEELSGTHMESTDYSLNPVDAFIDYLFTIREEMW